jgi:hypothetical protein
LRGGIENRKLKLDIFFFFFFSSALSPSFFMNIEVRVILFGAAHALCVGEISQSIFEMTVFFHTYRARDIDINCGESEIF